MFKPLVLRHDSLELNGAVVDQGCLRIQVVKLVAQPELKTVRASATLERAVGDVVLVVLVEQIGSYHTRVLTLECC